MSKEYRRKQVVQPTFSDEELFLKSFAKSSCNKCYSTGRRGFQLTFGAYKLPKPVAIACKCVPTSLINHQSY